MTEMKSTFILRSIKLLIGWVGTKTARYRPINHPGWYIILSNRKEEEDRENMGN